MSVAGFHGWATKRNATVFLRAIQSAGLNRLADITVHPAYNRFFRFWVIARPDERAEMTLLMERDGTWARGRLFDPPPLDADAGAIWVSIPGPQRIAAHLTHVVSVGEVRGSLRYPVEPGTLSARCGACWWTYTSSDEQEVRAASQEHHQNPHPNN